MQRPRGGRAAQSGAPAGRPAGPAPWRRTRAARRGRGDGLRPRPGALRGGDADGGAGELPGGLRLRRLRAELRDPRAGALLLQQPARRLRSLPGLRPRAGARPRARDPGSAEEPREGSHRALHHAARPALAAPPAAGLSRAGRPHRPARGRALRRRAGLDLRRRRRLERRQGLLRAPRAQALQGGGARDDRALPPLRSLPGVPRHAAARRRRLRAAGRAGRAADWGGWAGARSAS